MLARLALGLPAGLRARPQPLWASLQHAAGFADLNLSDPAVLKKFVGVEDLLGREENARGTLTGLLQQLRAAVAGMPADADYRRAIEATVAYRLKVLDANESDAAAEEVLDSHLEELILECREEINLAAIMAGGHPEGLGLGVGGGREGGGAGQAGQAAVVGGAGRRGPARGAQAALRRGALPGRGMRPPPCPPRPPRPRRRAKAVGRARGLLGARVRLHQRRHGARRQPHAAQVTGTAERACPPPRTPRARRQRAPPRCFCRAACGCALGHAAARPRLDPNPHALPRP
jgi:hypothetical protein